MAHQQDYLCRKCSFTTLFPTYLFVFGLAAGLMSRNFGLFVGRSGSWADSLDCNEVTQHHTGEKRSDQMTSLWIACRPHVEQFGCSTTACRHPWPLLLDRRMET